MSKEPGAERQDADTPIFRRRSPTGMASTDDSVRQPAGFGRPGSPAPGKGHGGPSSESPSHRRGFIDAKMKPEEVCDVIQAVMPPEDIPGISGYMLVPSPEHVRVSATRMRTLRMVIDLCIMGFILESLFVVNTHVCIL